MVVQHNLTAMNSNRMLGVTMGTLAKSTEKLSSGYKVNRAADDAAGLSISEKMRKQMRGLTQASLNAQDGISSVQTAEGALTEVHEMLQRMNELAVKSSNGTNSESDRQAIQDEIDQLVTEIDRVAETTKFNETYLLKGEPEGGERRMNLAAHDAGLAGKLTDNGDGTYSFKLNKALEDGQLVSIAGKEYRLGSTESSTDGFLESTELDARKVDIGDTVVRTDGTTKTLVAKAINDAGNYATGAELEIDGVKYTIAAATDLGAGEVKADDAVKLVSDALAKGSTAKIVKTGTAAPTAGIYAKESAVEVEIVTSLKADEVSAYTIAVGTAGTPATAKELAGGVLNEGDTVTIEGKTIMATDENPVTMNNIKNVIKQLKPGSGDVVTIGGTAMNVADKTDVAANDYAIEDILALLNDKDVVAITANSEEAKAAMLVANLTAGANYTAVETKVADPSENVITVREAYNKMAEELTKASSIGTDEGFEATVKTDYSGSFIINQGSVTVKKSLAFSLHVGADADMTNKIGVNIEAMDSKGLGIQKLNVLDIDGSEATYAIDAIADAVAKVSAQRSLLGAVQNRLEHTIKNLDNIIENTTAAESQIRDTDMATEMVKYSNNNILAQAGQSMLAQSNQSNQGILSLLG